MVLEGLARGERVTAAAVALLARLYAATGRGDVRDALEPALAEALELAREEQGTPRRSEWLAALADATSVSDDERLRGAASTLAANLAEEWPSRGTVEEAMQAIGSCLEAAGLLGSDRLIASAVDELERVVAVSYEPGDGLGRYAGSATRVSGELGDHVAAARALLAAYDLTGRLPYSMLAEELIQFARGVWWDSGAGVFRGSFIENCSVARVLCRLAALHADDEYHRLAAVTPGVDYAVDAERILDRLTSACGEQGSEAARYAIALDDHAAYDRIHRRS
jgi:hypothetical protein